jgi:putative transposase
MIIQRAYQYRFYPTCTQRKQLAQSFGCARYVYNWGLQLRKEAWEEEKKSINYNATSKLLTELKRDPSTAFLKQVSSVILQQSLRNLDRAFQNFFDKRSQYPRFKKKCDRQSIRFNRCGFTYKQGKLWLAKHDMPLNISWSRPIPEDAKLLSITIKLDRSNRYFISIHVETDIKPLEPREEAIGLDVNIQNLAELSNGKILLNPRHLKVKEDRLKKRQRDLSRKEKGSRNREKARNRLAKMYAKVTDTRQDYLHKFTTTTIRENQTVVVEGLCIIGMLKNHSLAKHIADAAWGEMFRQFEYKAYWYGRNYIEVDRFFPSSKMCYKCGHLLETLPLSVRKWDCPECKTHHGRDSNAAKNILSAGLLLIYPVGRWESYAYEI